MRHEAGLTSLRNLPSTITTLLGSRVGTEVSPKLNRLPETTLQIDSQENFFSLLIEVRLHCRPFGYDPLFQILPKSYQKLAGQSYNTDTPHPFAPVAVSFRKPLAKLTARLVPQPVPAHLNHERPYAAIPALADALFALRAAAVVGRWRKARSRPHFFHIVKQAPAKKLMHQDPAAYGTDPMPLT